MPKTYSREDLVNAINKIRNGAKIRATERKYNIPHATIMDKLKEKSSLDARKGPSTILTHDEEELLCLWLKAITKKGIPVEPRQLVDALQDILKKDGRPSPFTNGRPGRKWLDLFFKRHPDISLRKPEALGIGRSLVTERAIKKWHADLKNYIVEQTGDAKLLEHPDRILNGDESGFQTNPVTSLVIGPKGFKDLYEVRGSNMECITVMVTFDAAGNMAPPCIVFPYERIPAEISHNVNPDWSLGRSKSGWMTSQVFYGYVANSLLPFLKEKNTQFPVLFLIDGHKSHISYEVAMFCKENDIILYSLLPNATHILQPADVSVFRSIKCSWKKIVSDWQKKTGNRTVTRTNFAPLIEAALLAASKDILQSGFKKCGIYPFNSDNIDYSKCMSHEYRVVEKPCQFKTEHLLFLESMLSSSRIKEFRNSGEEWYGDVSARELFYVWKKIKNYISTQEKLTSVDRPLTTNLEDPHSSSQEKLTPVDHHLTTNLEDPHSSSQEKLTPVDHHLTTNLGGPHSSSQEKLTPVEAPPMNNLEGPHISSQEKLTTVHPPPTNNPEDPLSDELLLIPMMNIDTSITSSNPDLTNMIEFFHDDQASHLVESNMECVTPSVRKPTTNSISPAFADCVLWPSESPVKKGVKARKKIKLPDAVGAGAWVDYWENQKKMKFLKEENKRKRLEKKLERELLKKKKMDKEVNKKQAQRKRRKKEYISSTEEEDNCQIDVKDESNFETDDLNNILEPRSPSPIEEMTRDPVKDDYALIKFPVTGGNKEAFYVGKLLKIKGKELLVSCLRKSKKCTNKFFFPHVADMTNIDSDQIVYILKPTMSGGTKRQQSYVSFNINLEKFNVH